MFKKVNCPRCKIEHDTYLHAHHIYNDLRCDACSCEDLEKGQDCVYHHENGKKTHHKIVSVDNNVCGDGCCQQYFLTGLDYGVWKNNVEGIYK